MARTFELKLHESYKDKPIYEEMLTKLGYVGEKLAVHLKLGDTLDIDGTKFTIYKVEHCLEYHSKLESYSSTLTTFLLILEGKSIEE